MTHLDLLALDELLSTLPDASVLLHSPWAEQIACFEKYFTQIEVVSINEWDLLNKSDLHAEILFISNVLMYISNPKLAIENALNSCDRLIIQDLISRKRSPDSEFGIDGDCMRFSFGGDGFGYSLDYLNPIYYKSYMDGESKQFIMMV